MFIKLFLKLRKLLIHFKIWMQRTMSWIALANSAMILFLVLSKIQDYGIKVHITAWFIPILIAFFALMVMFGYIEDLVGFHREESRAIAKRNPYFDEILQRLDKIEKRLKKIK